MGATATRRQEIAAVLWEDGSIEGDAAAFERWLVDHLPLRKVA
jgi:hypothetical protein